METERIKALIEAAIPGAQAETTAPLILYCATRLPNVILPSRRHGGSTTGGARWGTVKVR